MPTQAYLRECFDYDPETGILRWKVRPLAHFKNAHGMNSFNAQHAERECRRPMPKGYLTVNIAGRSYLVHRLVWKLTTGQEPTGEIDHKNGVRDCNRWDNLRDATHQQTAINRGATVASRTGVKGVHWDDSKRCYTVFITVGGRTKYCGRFDDIEAARQRQRAAEVEAHGAFAHQQGVSR
jgi:hypothetical protein